MSDNQNNLCQHCGESFDRMVYVNINYRYDKNGVGLFERDIILCEKCDKDFGNKLNHYCQIDNKTLLNARYSGGDIVRKRDSNEIVEL